MVQEGTGAILSAFQSGSVQTTRDAIESSQNPVQSVSAIVGRDVSPYKADGNLIGGLDASTFDLTAYLVERLERWNEREQK